MSHGPWNVQLRAVRAGLEREQLRGPLQEGDNFSIAVGDCQLWWICSQ